MLFHNECSIHLCMIFSMYGGTWHSVCVFVHRACSVYFSQSCTRDPYCVVVVALLFFGAPMLGGSTVWDTRDPVSPIFTLSCPLWVDHNRYCHGINAWLCTHSQKKGMLLCKLSMHPSSAVSSSYTCYRHAPTSATDTLHCNIRWAIDPHQVKHQQHMGKLFADALL